MDSNATTLSVQEAVPREEGALRLLLLAALWLAVAVAVEFGAAVAFGVAMRLAGHGDGTASSVPRWVLPVMSTGVLQVAILLAAWRRGRIVGHGDRSVGLGLAPPHRTALLILFLVAILPVALGWSVMLGRLLGTPHLALLSSLSRENGWRPSLVSGASLLLVGAVLPAFAEEWFFRGWLWTGLRRHWGPWPVALTTGGMWLLAHATEGWTRPLFLLPSAVILSVARHRCDSVRGCTLLHLVNNGAALALLLLVSSMEHDVGTA